MSKAVDIIGGVLIDGVLFVHTMHYDDVIRVIICKQKKPYRMFSDDEKKEWNRPSGEWIYGEDDSGQDGWFCSECKFFVPWYYQYYEKDVDFIWDYKVCPHCLAGMVTYTGKDSDMKGGDKEAICKNCAHYSFTGRHGKTYCKHPRIFYCRIPLQMNPDDFCNYFKMKEGE